MIEIGNVRAGYGAGADVLHGVSLTASPGRILAILGPNGCGKSTLLKVIAGFLQPRSGQVLVDGRDLGAVPAHDKVRRHGFGFVPQTENVFTNMTVLENIQLGGRWLPEREFQSRLDELLALYPALAAKRNHAAWALSGGERQLLSLARALVARPRVLLLDEPSAGLSPRVLQEVFGAIAAIRDRTDTAIVMVEQNATEALRIADEAVILTLGQIAMSGKASDLLADPRVRELYLGGAVPAAVH